MRNKKDVFGFNKAINWDKLNDPKVIEELEKVFNEKPKNEVKKWKLNKFTMNEDVYSEELPKVLNEKPKKDNSKKGDVFLNCRSCKTIIKNDWYSNLDKRYCRDCL